MYKMGEYEYILSNFTINCILNNRIEYIDRYDNKQFFNFDKNDDVLVLYKNNINIFTNKHPDNKLITFSKIIYCKITDKSNNIISENKKYNSILKDLKIFQKNSCDASSSFKKIIDYTAQNNYFITITILLNNDILYKYKNYI